jgi:hypothetical protein
MQDCWFREEKVLSVQIPATVNKSVRWPKSVTYGRTMFSDMKTQRIMFPVVSIYASCLEGIHFRLAFKTRLILRTVLIGCSQLLYIAQCPTLSWPNQCYLLGRGLLCNALYVGDIKVRVTNFNYTEQVMTWLARMTQRPESCWWMYDNARESGMRGTVHKPETIGRQKSFPNILL